MNQPGKLQCKPRRTIALASVVLLGACRAPIAPSVAASGANAAAKATPAADPWSALSWEDRHDRMTWVVHPNMAKVFQRFEGTPYPKLTCRTCHGADAEQVQYKMPHGLPSLDPARMPDPNGGGPKARIAKFMIDEVTPQMVDLMSVERYDARTGRGFGCFACHPVSR